MKCTFWGRLAKEPVGLAALGMKGWGWCCVGGGVGLWAFPLWDSEDEDK